MDWYDAAGESMSISDWNSPENRTLQYVAASTPEHEPFNRILTVIHGVETPITVTLPVHDGVEAYELLWDSGVDAWAGHHQGVEPARFAPGEVVEVAAASLQLYRGV